MKKFLQKASLYIHIPFCRKKCFYCSFPVAVVGQASIEKYLKCLLREIKFYKGKKLKTIYLGGGTPSLLNRDQLEKILSAIKSNFHYLSDTEFTIESNPDDIDYAKMKAIKTCGINRISLGVQSFNDHYLEYLGRTHKCSDVYNAFEILRKVGFDNINLDVMYSFPEQTSREIKKDLKSLVHLRPEHVSCYCLSIEQQSRFLLKGVSLPAGQNQAKAYECVRRFLEENGFHQYEVSNFAKAKRKSQHNLNYWEGGNYIGVGMGAHSHCDGKRSWNVSKLKEYIRKIEAGESPQEGCEYLTSDKRLKETMLFGLRMNKGVNVRILEDKFQCHITREEKKEINCFVKNGLLDNNKGCIRATDKGRLVLDEISARLI